MCFKGLNQRFVKAVTFVRLLEKSQDNISKLAAIEKEPLTLEKDKEGKNKYYLSYPRALILDVKLANRDINVVEWTKIPKFSKVDDIVTPLRLLELLFDVVLVDVLIILIFKHATA